MLEILRISEPRTEYGSVPLREVEVAWGGKLVEPFKIHEDTFRSLDEREMRVLFREYAEGLLETFGPWDRNKRRK